MSDRHALTGKSVRRTIPQRRVSLAWFEHPADNREVAGSNPASPTPLNHRNAHERQMSGAIMDGVVASGSGDSGLANALAKSLGWKHLNLETRRFPDTEGYVRVPDDCLDFVRSGPVALVSTTFPDSAILETLFLLDAIRDVRSGEMSSLKGEKLGSRRWPRHFLNYSILWVFTSR